MNINKSTLAAAAALGLVLSFGAMTGCSPQGGNSEPGKAGTPSAGTQKILPPMPGAVPFKAEKPEVPDAKALQKAIDEQKAKQDADAKLAPKSKEDETPASATQPKAAEDTGVPAKKK